MLSPSSSIPAKVVLSQTARLRLALLGLLFAASSVEKEGSGFRPCPGKSEEIRGKRCAMFGFLRLTRIEGHYQGIRSHYWGTRIPLV